MKSGSSRTDDADSSAQPALISVIVPVHNGAFALSRCLDGVIASSYPHIECIVVDDSSTDRSPEIARQFSVKLLPLSGGPHGPAYARNRAAEAASGDILFFVDSDVILHRDAIANAARVLHDHPEIDAVFGMYDKNPEARDLISQYRNLLHHFVHQTGHEESATFWSGCGAMRRRAFFAVGGFDERRYSRPSIEDIDLGVRLKLAGRRIQLNKNILACHLKYWSLRRMVISDIFDRGIPWALLIWREKQLPNDLNLRLSQRLSALLTGIMLFILGFVALFPDTAILALIFGMFLLSVGRWRWPGALAPAVSRRADFLTGLVLIVTSLLAGLTDRLVILPLISPVLLVALTGPGLLSSSAFGSREFFVIEVLGLALAFGFEMAHFPPEMALSFLLSLGLILLLNRELYTFFTRERGLAFTLAVVPFHLLYYLYSVLAFAFGTCFHVFVQYHSRHNVS